MIMEPELKKQRMVIVVEKRANGDIEVERYGDDLWPQLKLQFLDEIRGQIADSKEDLM